MALSISQTVALAEILKPGMSIASLGYPDILIEAANLLSMFSFDNFKDLKYRSDSEVICKRHGLQNRPIPDAHSFFKLQGCDLDVYDIVQERGCEIVEDLNEDWRDDYERRLSVKYDIVLDVGTVEHCFNIGQAMINMASLVKNGGYIIHENPFNWGNHGFYNLNPTFYVDFYTANGFEVLDIKIVDRKGIVVGAPPPTARFRFTESEVNVFVLAKRSCIKPMVYPVQSKYAKLIPAAGVRA